MAKLADAQDLESCGQPCEFKSHCPHQKILRRLKMITEYGSIKAGAKLDEKMQKELSGGLNIYALLLLIFGSIGTAAFLVLYIIGICISHGRRLLVFDASYNFRSAFGRRNRS